MGAAHDAATRAMRQAGRSRWSAQEARIYWDTFNDLWPKDNDLRSNPPNNLHMSDRVYAIQYRHVEDGQDYEHRFGPGVRMDAEPSGGIRLTHTKGRPLSEEF